MDTEEILKIKKQFRPLLPKGYLDKIRARLLKKGIKRSRSYIGYVCDPDRLDYEPEIFNEALQLAAAQKLINEKHIELAKSL